MKRVITILILNAIVALAGTTAFAAGSAQVSVRNETSQTQRVMVQLCTKFNANFPVDESCGSVTSARVA